MKISRSNYQVRIGVVRVQGQTLSQSDDTGTRIDSEKLQSFGVGYNAAGQHSLRNKKRNITFLL